MAAGWSRRSMWCACGCLVDGDNTECPTCRGQELLFDVRELHATRVSSRLDAEQAAAVLGAVAGGER